jgi:hypothetical protein
MTQNEVAAEVASRVTDEAVYDLAERMDCSLGVARWDLEAEAFAAVTGQDVDYSRNWRGHD